jgi:DNA-binding NtrC family response regulator
MASSIGAATPTLLAISGSRAVRDLVGALTAEGYQVVTASSPEGARACVGRQRVDLVIAQVWVPGATPRAWSVALFAQAAQQIEAALECLTRAGVTGIPRRLDLDGFLTAVVRQ